MRSVFTSFSVGFVLAMVLSWVTHHSVIWAIIHGILSWFYLIYYAITNI